MLCCHRLCRWCLLSYNDYVLISISMSFVVLVLITVWPCSYHWNANVKNKSFWLLFLGSFVLYFYFLLARNCPVGVSAFPTLKNFTQSFWQVTISLIESQRAWNTNNSSDESSTFLINCGGPLLLSSEKAWDKIRMVLVYLEILQ